VEGRAAIFEPGGGCLRCVFPTPPGAGELPTCDTAGVFGPAVMMVSALQSALTLRQLIEPASTPRSLLFTLDAWSIRQKEIRIDRDPSCACCVGGIFDAMNATSGGATLCGRSAVQVRGVGRLDLQRLAEKLKPIATIQTSAMMVRFVVDAEPDLAMSVFADGRLIVFGTSDPARARSIYAKYIGM
jgi:molybdopterin-synthase adenylyltransferase